MKRRRRQALPPAPSDVSFAQCALLRTAPLAALTALFLCALSCGHPQSNGTTPQANAHAEDGRWLVREPIRVAPLERGFSFPYAVDRIYGTFGDCRPGGRQHRGLDLGGVGANDGLGSPVRAMVRSTVVSIHRPEDDPGLYGRRDTRDGTTERSGHDLPRSARIPGYGIVQFFTRDYGSWHTGEMIVMRAIGTDIDGYRIRYMHLGAVHPELRVGDIVEAGQQVGVMGGTAVMESLPHVHIDIEDTRGQRVDVAPLLGLEADRSRCR